MLRLKEKIIREMIAKTGYTVKAWGEMHNFSQTTLSNWITGRRNIKRSSLEKLAAALRCDIFDIASVVMEYTGAGVSELKADREDICGLFGGLDDKQRKAIIHIAELMEKGNREIEHLQHGVED